MKSFKIRTDMPGSMLYRQVQKMVSFNDEDTKEIKEERRSFLYPNVPFNPDGTPKQLAIDQFSGKCFMRNASGWPMNDIMAYEQAQEESIAQSVLRRIQVLPGNKDSGLSLQERFDRIVPSNWSSPAEYLNLMEKVAQLDLRKAQELAAYQAEQAKAIKAKSKKAPDKTVDVTPE